MAVAPTATIASIAGCYECIEPQVSNLFKRETLSGDFLQVNRYLVNELKALGLWTETMRGRLKMAEGSVQALDELPADLRAVYRTVWELPMRALIDMAADRGAFIDQSQSLNLFVENPNIGQLSSMYFYAWKQRPQDHVLPALASRHAHRQGHGGDRRGAGADRTRPGHGGRLLLARESRELRGLPVSHVTRPSRLLDPGLCLTLRPMAYPTFFEMYRGAIKNTWTVEEVDFATDVGDLSAQDDRRRAPPGAAAGRVLRHR